MMDFLVTTVTRMTYFTQGSFIISIIYDMIFNNTGNAIIYWIKCMFLTMFIALFSCMNYHDFRVKICTSYNFPNHEFCLLSLNDTPYVAFKEVVCLIFPCLYILSIPSLFSQDKTQTVTIQYTNQDVITNQKQSRNKHDV